MQLKCNEWYGVFIPKFLMFSMCTHPGAYQFIVSPSLLTWSIESLLAKHKCKIQSITLLGGRPPKYDTQKPGFMHELSCQVRSKWLKSLCKIFQVWCTSVETNNSHNTVIQWGNVQNPNGKIFIPWKRDIHKLTEWIINSERVEEVGEWKRACKA